MLGVDEEVLIKHFAISMCIVRCELCTFVVVDNIWFIMCFLYI